MRLDLSFLGMRLTSNLSKYKYLGNILSILAFLGRNMPGRALLSRLAGVVGATGDPMRLMFNMHVPYYIGKV